MRSNRRCEFTGAVLAVRAVEDCIRATKKYTEGIGTVRKKHPIQGEDFPSKKFCKYYEVYPDMEIGWDMPASVTLDWLWGETPCIDVLFNYDYRINKASVILQNPGDAKELGKAIPGFEEMLAQITPGNPMTKKAVLAIPSQTATYHP
jgi:hypothetical protein